MFLEKLHKTCSQIKIMNKYLANYGLDDHNML